MEFCDVVDEHGVRTGRVVVRGTSLPPGEFYPVVHVWIRDEKGIYLIQQRALHLLSGPGMWAATVGYLLAGEESISGAIREVKEELGIRLSPGQLRLFDRIKLDDRFEYLWLAVVNRGSLGEPELGPEVAAWKWASGDEIARMVKQGSFFSYSYLSSLVSPNP